MQRKTARRNKKGQERRETKAKQTKKDGRTKLRKQESKKSRRRPAERKTQSEEKREKEEQVIEQTPRKKAERLRNNLFSMLRHTETQNCKLYKEKKIAQRKYLQISRIIKLDKHTKQTNGQT